jgi:CheY-like chemotaxis protein
MPVLRPTVLVVEDDLTLLPLYECILALSGFDMIAATTGEAAVDIYRQRHEAIDLVVCDLCLPGMDGPSILAALHRVNPALRCFLLNDDSLTFAEASLRQYGCLGIINKPTQVPGMGNLLRQALNQISPAECPVVEAPFPSVTPSGLRPPHSGQLGKDRPTPAPGQPDRNNPVDASEQPGAGPKRREGKG